MLRHFQPFVDYEKLIKMNANKECYRLSKQEINGKYNSPLVKSVKVRKLGKK